jgi:sugar phosphate isomerase/epimerase
MLTGELSRPTVAELFDAIQSYGFGEVQLGLSSFGLGEMPSLVEPERLEDIYEQASSRAIDIVAVNGTFNMIHPDRAVREEGIRRLDVTAQACKYLHCGFVTLCTGTRNLESMWRWHDGNREPDAWDDLLETMAQAVAIADRYDLLLGIETEASNVVNSPERARALLDAFPSGRLKIIMDVANLFQRGQAHPENVRPVIDNAFELLGRDIQIAHGKDIKAGDGLEFTHAGNGIVDYPYFVEKLAASGYTGGFLVHGIKGEQYFPGVVSFMRGVLAEHPARSR